MVGRGRWAGALALAMALGTAGNAQGFVVGPGGRPSLAVDATGAAHVAWREDTSGGAKVRYCKVPAGGSACTQAFAFLYSDVLKTVHQPRILLADDNNLAIVVGQQSPLQNDVFTSSNGGANWAGPTKRGDGQIGEDVVLSGPTLGFVVGSASGAQVSFQTLPLGSGVNGGHAVLDTEAGSISNRDVARQSDGVPVVTWARLGGTPGVFASRYQGAGDINSATSWTGRALVDASAIDPSLSSAGGDVHLLTRTIGQGMAIRRWNGSSFEGPAAISANEGRASHLFTQPNGVLHAVWEHPRDGTDAIRWWTSTDGVYDVAYDEDVNYLRVAVNVAGAGYAVYASNLNAASTDEVRLVALSRVPGTAGDVPGGGGPGGGAPGGGPGPGGTGGTGGAGAVADQTPGRSDPFGSFHRGILGTTTSAVGPYRLSFDTPRTCAFVGRRVRLRLRTRSLAIIRRRFLAQGIRYSIRRVDFTLDGRRFARDFRGPYTAILNTRNLRAGSGHVLRARVFVRRSRFQRGRLIRRLNLLRTVRRNLRICT